MKISTKPLTARTRVEASETCYALVGGKHVGGEFQMKVDFRWSGNAEPPYDPHSIEVVLSFKEAMELAAELIKFAQNGLTRP